MAKKFDADTTTDNLTRLDMTNVTKPCVACGGTVVTTHTRTAVCAKCRAKGLAGKDELESACNNVYKARVAVKACHDELSELRKFECPCCKENIDVNEELHGPDCEIAYTLELPMETDDG
mgnify:CR=1 FL=1